MHIGQQMRNARARAAWARQQRDAARARFAVSLPTVEDVRTKRVAELTQLADALRSNPHMATTLAAVEREIAALVA